MSTTLAAGPETCIIEASGISRSFLHENKEVHVLRDVSVSIAKGDMVALVGPSGAGKSTLLHILGTLDQPTSGELKYMGSPLSKYSSRQLADFRNTHLGFVFQFHHLLPEFNALENVMMPGLIQGSSKSKHAKRAEELLKEVGLYHRKNHRPSELSGGEQQRVALARALLMNPELVLADEPTGNLDTATSQSMQELFFKLNQTRGITFLIVTHSQELASSLPRVISMKDGEIVSDVRSQMNITLSTGEP